MGRAQGTDTNTRDSQMNMPVKIEIELRDGTIRSYPQTLLEPIDDPAIVYDGLRPYRFPITVDTSDAISVRIYQALDDDNYTNGPGL